MDGTRTPRARRIWGSVADGHLFGERPRARMLMALLAVGAILSVPVIVANVNEGRPAAVELEAALLAGKLACIAWVWRARRLSSAATGAIVAYNTVCATASNLLYPADLRPFTAQLLLSVLFIGWFIRGRARIAQLLLAAAGCLVTLAGAASAHAEALRVASLFIIGGTIAVLASALRERHEQLTLHATADPLTGVGNRRAYEDGVEAALAHARRFSEPVSLVMIDLDGFKRVNDTLGHPAGDAELQAVARMLTERTRAQDTVYRLGGDEFAVLLPGTTAEGAARFSRDVAGTHDGLRTSITAGVAEYPRHGEVQEDLTRAADDALLDGKRAGKRQVQVARDGGRFARRAAP